MSAHPPEHPGAITETGNAAKAPVQRMIPSADLLQGAREVRIEHRGVVYRLLETRNGKLILQK